MGKKVDLAVAALNGVIGDYLARTHNALATRMTLVGGATRAPRAVILVHGLMCTEDVFRFPDGSDYGSLLARDLDLTPFYARYNSGLPIADSGAELSSALDDLITDYGAPLEEIILIGYSMGGLVIRSACHVARTSRAAWLERAHRIIYIGTPHLGAPLERYTRAVAGFLGRIDDPYARLAAELAELRSDGIKDLGDADVRHEDRALRRGEVALRDARHPVPLLPELRHHLVAGMLTKDERIAELFGDALVPVPSATDGRADVGPRVNLSPDHVKVLPDIGHVALAHHPEVYAHVLSWCAKETT